MREAPRVRFDRTVSTVRINPVDLVDTLLDSAGVPRRIIAHERAWRARAEAEAVGLPPARVAKAVAFVERGDLTLAVVPASRRVDEDRLRRVLQAGRHLRPAREGELQKAFPHFELGALPALGRLIGVDQVIDPLLLAEPEAMICAGDQTHGMLLAPADLVRATESRIADICEHPVGGASHRFRDVPIV
jgi:Ala-tRNA(Pro) deacylase